MSSSGPIVIGLELLLRPDDMLQGGPELAASCPWVTSTMPIMNSHAVPGSAAGLAGPLGRTAKPALAHCDELLALSSRGSRRCSARQLRQYVRTTVRQKFGQQKARDPRRRRGSGPPPRLGRAPVPPPRGPPRAPPRPPSWPDADPGAAHFDQPGEAAAPGQQPPVMASIRLRSSLTSRAKIAPAGAVDQLEGEPDLPAPDGPRIRTPPSPTQDAAVGVMAAAVGTVGMMAPCTTPAGAG